MSRLGPAASRLGIQDPVDTASQSGSMRDQQAGRQLPIPAQRRRHGVRGRHRFSRAGVVPAGSPSDESGFAVLQGYRDTRGRTDGSEGGTRATPKHPHPLGTDEVFLCLDAVGLPGRGEGS